MVDRIGPVNAVANAPQYDGRWERQLRDVHQVMGSASRPLGARTGVRPGTPVTTVTATSTTWTCQPFAGDADVESAAEAGAYPFSFDAVATGAMTPADGSNARIDILYVQIDDPSEDGSSTPAVTRKYLAGVAGSGVAPTPPVTRAFVIAQINVPKSGAGAPSVTWVAPYTAAAGGVVPFVKVTDLKLWTPPADGQLAYAMDTRQAFAYLAGAAVPGWYHAAGAPAVATISYPGGGAGYVAYASAPLSLYEQAGGVHLSGAFTTSASSAAFAASTAYSFGSVPAVLAPAKQEKFIVTWGDTGIAQLTVNTDGTMLIRFTTAPGTVGPNVLVVFLSGVQWPNKNL